MTKTTRKIDRLRGLELDIHNLSTQSTNTTFDDDIQGLMQEVGKELRALREGTDLHKRTSTYLDKVSTQCAINALSKGNSTRSEHRMRSLCKELLLPSACAVKAQAEAMLALTTALETAVECALLSVLSFHFLSEFPANFKCKV
jgi:hypothetical protein